MASHVHSARADLNRFNGHPMWLKCSSEKTVVAEAIDLPSLLWRLCLREVDSMKGSRYLIKASALFVETWIILDERTYTDLWGQRHRFSRSLDSRSTERDIDINPPCVSQFSAWKFTSLHWASHLTNIMWTFNWNYFTFLWIYTSIKLLLCQKIKLRWLFINVANYGIKD